MIRLDNITFLIQEKLQFLPPMTIIFYILYLSSINISLKIIMLILLMIYTILLIITFGDIFLDDLGYPRKISALRCSFVFNMILLIFFTTNYILYHGWFNLFIFLSLIECIYRTYWFIYYET